MAYCSSTLSLCALESLVHFDLSEAPIDYASVVIVIDERIIMDVNDKSLPAMPANWRDTPAPSQLALIGHTWVKSGSSAVLQVPSVIIPSEKNYLVNPEHPDAKLIKVESPLPFSFDPRLFATE